METGVTSDICVWNKRVKHCDCAVRNEYRFARVHIRVLRLSIAFLNLSYFGFYSHYIRILVVQRMKVSDLLRFLELEIILRPSPPTYAHHS